MAVIPPIRLLDSLCVVDEKIAIIAGVVVGL